jgi:hypothetical protein
MESVIRETTAPNQERGEVKELEIFYLPIPLRYRKVRLGFFFSVSDLAQLGSVIEGFGVNFGKLTTDWDLTASEFENIHRSLTFV